MWTGRTERNLRVSAINMRNQPLMPTTNGKANHLLRQGKAKVVSINPFTVKLLYATGETKQDITLGIDSGFKHIGFSAITEKRELLSGEEVIRTNIPELNEEKAMYRRNRRNNRTLQLNRKGFKSSIRRKRHELQPGDIVKFQKGRCHVAGIHSYGKYVIIRNGEKKMDVNIKKVKIIKYGKGLRFAFQYLPMLKQGVSMGGSL
jgi:N6-L-threonylcarbamoyladenine synthase